jgi:hypothetical protein
MQGEPHNPEPLPATTDLQPGMPTAIEPRIAIAVGASILALWL